MTLYRDLCVFDALRMNMHACHDETHTISYLQPTADGEILRLSYKEWYNSDN